MKTPVQDESRRRYWRSLDELADTPEAKRLAVIEPLQERTPCLRTPHLDDGAIKRLAVERRRGERRVGHYCNSRESPGTLGLGFK